MKMSEKNQTKFDMSNGKSVEDDQQVKDPVPKDTGWGWMCVLGCFISNMFTVGGVIRSFGILYVVFMEKFDSTAGLAAWIAVLANVMLTAGGSITNALAMQLGNKLVVFIGGLFLAFGYITSIYATRLEHLFLTYGIFCGIGCALAWSPSIAHMGQYFKRYRAIANGIAISGKGLGVLIIPPLMRLLIDSYEITGALLIMAGLNLHVCVAGLLLRPPSFYEHKKIRENEKCPENQTANKNCINVLGTCKAITGALTSLEWSLLRSPTFLLHGLSIVFYFLSIPAYVIMLPPHAKQIGFSPTATAFLVSVVGVADLVGQLVLGLIADCKVMPTFVLMGIALLFSSGASYLTPFITGFVPLAFTVFIVGMASGPLIALNPVLLTETLGFKRLPSAHGITGIFMACGIAISIPSMGILKDYTGNWRSSYLINGTMFLLSALTTFLRPAAIKLERKFNISSSPC